MCAVYACLQWVSNTFLKFFLPILGGKFSSMAQNLVRNYVLSFFHRNLTTQICQKNFIFF